MEPELSETVGIGGPERYPEGDTHKMYKGTKCKLDLNRKADEKHLMMNSDYWPAFSTLICENINPGAKPEKNFPGSGAVDIRFKKSS